MATFGRASRLPGLVSAIREQEGVQGTVELIVVNDDSPDETAKVLDRLANEEVDNFRMRVLQLEENSGPAAARNAGWRAAAASVIAFTDDDCTPQQCWLAALVDALADADMVQGRTVPDPKDHSFHGPFSHDVQAHELSGHYETCNMAYRRSVLERCAGFYEGFRYPYGEDIDLALRGIESGARVAFAPDALVYHAVSRSSVRDRLKGTPRQEGLVLAVQRHPAFREQLYHKYWARPSHPPALLAGFGAMVAAGGLLRGRQVFLWAAAAAMFPYLNHRLRRGRLYRTRSHLPWVIPQVLALDLAEAAVLLRASLRYRTLVL